MDCTLQMPFIQTHKAYQEKLEVFQVKKEVFIQNHKF